MISIPPKRIRDRGRAIHDEQLDEALHDLAEVAYGARDAIWTSPRTLVKAALTQAEGAGFVAGRKTQARARITANNTWNFRR